VLFEQRYIILIERYFRPIDSSRGVILSEDTDMLTTNDKDNN